MSEGNGQTATVQLTRKDFVTDQDVRWCPGCGDYVILATIQSFLPELGIPRENLVFVSGIGCSSRFPYYVDTYGIHSIHGRAPAIATGIAVSRPDLSVWVASGDGDCLSIGGNHLIHAMRRNVNLTILMFNNQIYGLTKGQASPTSEQGKVTKSTPFGAADYPFNPLSLALGADCSFVARAIDSDRPGLTSVLRQAAQRKGTKFVEIYQNCNVFNDDAFIALTGRDTKKANQIRLEHGKPIRFGASEERGVAVDSDGTLRIVNVQDVGEERLLVHDERALDASRAFALSRLSSGPTGPTPLGVFRDVPRPSYDDIVRRQVEEAKASKGPGELAALLHSGDTWQVG